MQAIFTLSIGLKDKDARKQLISCRAAKDLIFDILGDCTILQGEGQFIHKDGGRVREKSLRVYVYDDDTAFSAIVEKAKQICITLNQECVIVQMMRENGSFTTEFVGF